MIPLALAAVAAVAAAPSAPPRITAAAWSPAGAQIALEATVDPARCGLPDERPVLPDVYVAKPDGTALRRAAPGSAAEPRTRPLWSRDGQRLATARTGGPDPYVSVLARDGTELASRQFAEPVAWAPDSRRLAVDLYDPTDSPVSLGVFDVRSGTVREVGRYSKGTAAWSPSGRLLAWAERAGVFVVRPDGTSRRRLARRADVNRVAWSADGRFVAYSRSPSSVAVVELDGSKRLRVDRASAWEWSPRGRRLAAGGVVVDLPSGLSSRVVPPGVRGPVEPAWSPDGSRLALVARSGLYVVDAAAPRRGVVHSRVVPRSAPSWSPDGRSIVFAAARGLYVLRAATGGGRYLPLDWCDAIAPQGEQIR